RGEAIMYRTWPSRGEHSPAMRALGTQPIELVRDASRRTDGEPAVHAADRRGPPWSTNRGPRHDCIIPPERPPKAIRPGTPHETKPAAGHRAPGNRRLGMGVRSTRRRAGLPGIFENGRLE